MGTFSVAPNKSKGAFKGVPTNRELLIFWKMIRFDVFHWSFSLDFIPSEAPYDLFGATENVPWLNDFQTLFFQPLKYVITPVTIFEKNSAS